MQTYLSVYHALRAEVVVIVGQRAARVAAYRSARGFAFPILVDPDRAVIKGYGVYHRLGLTAFNIARPAVFLIDREQRIRFIHVSRDQSDRPDHETLVAELQKLHPPQAMSPPPAVGAQPVEPSPQ